MMAKSDDTYVYPPISFVDFWRKLNAALTVRDQPEALFGEARQWYDWRPVKRVDDRLVNQLLHAR